MASGRLLPTLPLFWAATPELVDEITDVDAPPWDEGGLVVIQLEGSIPYGVVTSQTCDIAATGPGCHHPTVQVSPVVAVEIDAGTLGNIRRFRMKAHALMTAADLDGTYVADLRISLPVSKAVLVAEPMASATRLMRFSSASTWLTSSDDQRYIPTCLRSFPAPSALRSRPPEQVRGGRRLKKYDFASKAIG